MPLPSTWIGSPNKSQSRQGFRPEAVVVHIMEGSHVGWTSNGPSVNGNAHWYKDADGNYLWAGRTDKPIPGMQA